MPVTLIKSGVVSPVNQPGNAVTFSWSGFATSGDTGDEIDFGDYADRSAQVEGDFGAGGVIVVEGSNDGVNWRTLRDPQGAALLFSAADVRQVLELTKWLRARQSAGSGADLEVTVFTRSSR
jgi:hypothetical protein